MTMKTTHFYGAAALVFLFLLQGSTLSAQTTHRVPADYPGIQLAIDAAQTGDTVLVSPGIYFENLQLRGRDIVLSSRYFMDADPAQTIRETIIDGSQPVHPDTASCLLIWKGETAATVVQGFTFRGGSGTRWYDHFVPGYYREGGGILTDLSSPIIRHNIIRDNVVPKEGAQVISNGGGGIRCGEGAPRIEGNYIVHNQAEGYGGGVVLNYCPGAVLAHNVVANNYGGKSYSGAGVWLNGVAGTYVTLLNNTIARNHSPGQPTQYGGKAGGVWAFSITVKMMNNIVWDNIQASGKPLAGAGAVYNVEYSCVQTGFNGTGNIAANPMFRDTLSFVLETGSPARDAGNPDPQYDDLTRNGYSAGFPARGSLRADMGAYGGNDLRNPAFPGSFSNALIFSKVLNSPVVNTPGDSRAVNWVDVDGDKDYDLFITNGPEAGENNLLYINNGTGAFAVVSGDPIVSDNKPSDGATWGDYDNDGDEDCFVANWYGINNLLYKNFGNGSFEQITTGAIVNDGGFSETASWGDYDGDGWLDLYVTNSSGNYRNFLYRNNGDGTFQKITSGSPVTDGFASRSVNWTDFNNDGEMDLFVTNEGVQNENLYRNNGDGSFTKLSGGPLLTAGSKTMSSSWGDYDNDGDLDVFLANDQANDGLYRNDGNETFVKITDDPVSTSGGNSFSSQWADVDNDGDLDLFVTNSFWGGPWKNFLFFNNGNGTFTKDITELPAIDEGWSYGCAFGDMDGDGDLDLAVATCLNAVQTDYLYENHSSDNGNRWIQTKLRGTTSNRSAIGAKVWATALINGETVTQLQEISAQSGHCGQNQAAAHFGLADADSVAIVVHWPSGLIESFAGLSLNMCHNLVEGQGVGALEAPTYRKNLFLQPNPSSDSVMVVWEQPEPEQLTLRVSDMAGRVLYSQTINAASGINQYQLSSDLPAGNYQITLLGAHWQSTRKLVRTE